MSGAVLGISAFYHDSAAAIVRDGQIVAAAQQERFSRRRHDPAFPRQAINYCLEEAFLEPAELEAVVFYDHPLLTLDRVLRSLAAVAPSGRDQWLAAAPALLGVKLFVADFVRRSLRCEVPVLFTRHHLAHAASAFYPSPFPRAAILTVDGVGEWATTTLGVGNGTQIQLQDEIRYPHSLGLLYSALTYHAGFKVNSGEYKLMGLAPYGRPRYAERIREHLVDQRPDGSFRLRTEYFDFVAGLRMTNERMNDLLDGPPRAPESRITRREMDLAASIQQVTEELMLALARRACQQAQCDDLVLAGGVALNCVANGRLLRERACGRLWIQPAAGDAGGSLGAALTISHRKLGAPRRLPPGGRDLQQGSYLGPAYRSAEIRAWLDRQSLPYRHWPDRAERIRQVASALAQGRVVGFFSGRMEFGPRSLGARSILADPRRPDTQATLNLKIKYRESFRPFAPAVLADRASEYFELEQSSPYMLLVAPVRPERCLPPAPGDSSEPSDDDLLAIVRRVRSEIPAVTHVDKSARVQTVDEHDHPEFHALLTEFDRQTGCPVLVNTSFNVRGEPIVCSPQDAYRCFMRTEIDLLVLEDCLLEKTDQPPLAGDENWRARYELD